jgi:hypothetical protein
MWQRVRKTRYTGLRAAAFAMANYSSTIGRIAKPFNPMLVSLRFFL